ncbi:glycosyltransferase [Nitrincola alkalilacustris]|uniref:glycosyltransferase n=1 Tax=Nitrincola alkalilacustris TaxID=1571224 RepID=UPI00124EF00D|nr:glycosyltransferase [Nitrincola alkalilacustris]
MAGWSGGAPPRVLVCLAAYQGMPWLQEQVESILTQQGVDVTLLISIDPSADGTEAWFESLAAERDNIHVLPTQQRFGCAAANFFRLLREADVLDYDLVSLADQDDIWFPDKLVRAATFLEQHPGIDAYSSNVLAFWPDGRERLVRKAQPQVAWDHLFEAPGPGCTFVMRSDPVCRLQHFCKQNEQALGEVMSHDWFIYAWFRTQELRWFIDPEPGLRYRQHDSNELGMNRGLAAYRSRLSKVLKGEWFTQATLIARLTGVEKEAFVRPWIALTPAGFFYLSLRSHLCRRRWRDRLAFSLLCLLRCFV